MVGLRHRPLSDGNDSTAAERRRAAVRLGVCERCCAGCCTAAGGQHHRRQWRAGRLCLAGGKESNESWLMCRMREARRPPWAASRAGHPRLSSPLPSFFFFFFFFWGGWVVVLWAVPWRVRVVWWGRGWWGGVARSAVPAGRWGGCGRVRAVRRAWRGGGSLRVRCRGRAPGADVLGFVRAGCRRGGGRRAVLAGARPPAGPPGSTAGTRRVDTRHRLGAGTRASRWSSSAHRHWAQDPAAALGHRRPRWISPIAG